MKARSVRATAIENELVALFDALSVKPELLDQVHTVAQEEFGRARTLSSGRTFAAEKAAAIQTLRRRIEAAVTLYGDGRIDTADYRTRVESCERQIEEWESRRTSAEQVAVDEHQTAAAIGNLRRLWTIADDEDRQKIIRVLFEEISVHLDAREITGFRLKTGAHTYVRARASLLKMADQGFGTDMLHTRFELVFWP